MRRRVRPTRVFAPVGVMRFTEGVIARVCECFPVERCELYGACNVTSYPSQVRLMVARFFREVISVRPPRKGRRGYPRYWRIGYGECKGFSPIPMSVTCKFVGGRTAKVLDRIRSCYIEPPDAEAIRSAVLGKRGLCELLHTSEAVYELSDTDLADMRARHIQYRRYRTKVTKERERRRKLLP